MKTLNSQPIARRIQKGTAVIAAVGLVFSQALTGVLAAPAVPMAVPALDIASQVGAVAAVRGLVTLARTGEVGRVVQSGAPIYLGDNISTDDKGQLQILLMDETVFTIGANSSMIIDKFVYDPSTDAGKIEATVTKGVFRFITGRIAKQKPENMQVHLPVGTIGVRGTIVAGEVQGQQSTIVLMGPGPNTTTDHRIGSFILENQVQDSGTSQTHTESTHVTRIGYATQIMGEDQAPTPAFQAPESLIQKITDSFSGSNEVAQQEDGSENARQNSQRQDAEGENKDSQNRDSREPSKQEDSADPKAEDTAPRNADTEQKSAIQGPNDPNGGGLGGSLSGFQDPNSTGGNDFKRGGDPTKFGSLNDNLLGRDFFKVIQEAARDVVKNTDGGGSGSGKIRLTSLEQLNGIDTVTDGNTQTQASFRQYFIDTSVGMTDGSTYKIAFDFNVDADKHTYGGGNSQILAIGTSNVGDFKFTLGESAFLLSGNAEITLSGISNSASSLCSQCTGQLTIQFLNANSDVKTGDGIALVATEVTHTLKVFNGSGDLLTQTAATETTLSTRIEGVAPTVPA